MGFIIDSGQHKASPRFHFPMSCSGPCLMTKIIWKRILSEFLKIGFTFESEFHSQTYHKDTKVSRQPCFCTVQPPLPLTSTSRMVHLLRLMDLHWYITVPKVCSSHQGSLLVLYFVWIWTHIWRPTSTISVSIRAHSLKITCALPVCSSFLSLLETTCHFTVSMVQPFPECHIVGIRLHNG